MSDYNSSLPIRTENPGDAIVKIADATVPSQQLKVESDGSINVNAALTATDLDIRDLDASQDNVAISDGTDTLAVNADGSINVVATATDLDIRDLAFATDKVDASGSTVALDAPTLAALESITVQNGSGASAVNIQDGGNTITVDAVDLDVRNLVFATDKVDVGGSVVALDSTTLAALESITVQNGAGGAAVNIQDGGNSLTVDANNLDIRDLTHVSDSVRIGDGTDFLAVNADGSINVVPQEDAGTERVSYNSASALAAAATSNHDLVVTNGGKLYQVLGTASGKLKVEVQVETGSSTNTFNTVAVGFNSTATPNVDLTLAKYATIPTGARVRVIRTNRDNQSQDVYSTIVCIES